jgi:hypothetical protein
MSADLLDDLLSGFTAPGAGALSAATPAKAANPAKREHPCGPPCELDPCESLRISANLARARRPPAQVSQKFAAIRNPQYGPESEQRRGLSQDSQLGAGVKHSHWAALSGGGPATVGRNCADCLHLTGVKNCREPVAAGLLTAEGGFGIAWPPPGHWASCPAFSGKGHSKAKERPYRLANAAGGAAHAKAWDDAAIARFQARAHRLVRLGIASQDAEDLAERLHLRDVTGDDRVLCVECNHYRAGKCGNPHQAWLSSPGLAATLQRCAGFKANPQ